MGWERFKKKKKESKTERPRCVRFPVAQNSPVLTVQRCGFPHSYQHGAHLIRDNKELREKTTNHVSFSLLQGGLLQTKSLVTSESSKGLQRAGVGSHFLAQECGALTFVTRPARGARRFLCRRLDSACKSFQPHAALAFLPSNPSSSF